MSGWTAEELTRARRADELRIASRRADGSLRRYVTIWVVRLGDELYVRSAYGYDNPWFQRGFVRVRDGSRPTASSATSRSRSRSPTLRPGSRRPTTPKYDRYGPAIVGTVTSTEAERATLRLVPW
jgi:hypothetical protein